jgi:glycosyltransferase involved in cell wall biosynthesis
VQTFAIVDAWSFDSALFCKSSDVPLFTENHVHESVVPRGLWQTPRGWAVGVANRLRSRATTVNNETVTCFAISDDTYRIANRRFGVTRSKLRIQPLGVDTDVFRPADDRGWQRSKTRSGLGIADDEIACVYTGRLSPDKAPHLLAESVARLRAKGLPLRAIFVGAGDAAYVDQLRACQGSIVLPFRPTAELPEIYRASDVGVWPREESTSQLDAMACGLPLVVSDRVSAVERLGVGASFREGSAQALADAIASLRDPSVRRTFGHEAAQRIATGLSWHSIARGRLAAYEGELSRRMRRRIRG